MKPVLIVVDMVNEFVHGRLSTDQSKSLIEPSIYVVNHFRKIGGKIIYIKDSHNSLDFELNVWGNHSMENDPSSDIIDELKPKPDDIVIYKHTYSGFYGTILDNYLRALKADSLFFIGLDADICVRHTVADAFFRGYDTFVIKEAVASYIDKDWENYFRKVYDTRVISINELEEILKSYDIMEKLPQQ